eukprot:1241121-Karenia_brevis.AAC.1
MHINQQSTSEMWWAYKIHQRSSCAGDISCIRSKGNKSCRDAMLLVDAPLAPHAEEALSDAGLGLNFFLAFSSSLCFSCSSHMVL